MPVLTVRTRRTRKRLVAAVLTAAALGGTGMVATPSAEASTLGAKAVNEAAHHKGQPYVYGAAGPTRFDCSGFTLYVYRRLGRALPHNAAQQYTTRGVRHISKSARTYGDLIFMRNSSGRIYHVGIYAGGNRWWVAPKSGDHVKLQTIYSSNYVVGRLG